MSSIKIKQPKGRPERPTVKIPPKEEDSNSSEEEQMQDDDENESTEVISNTISETKETEVISTKEEEMKTSVLKAESKVIGQQFHQFFSKLFGSTKFSDITLIVETTEEHEELERLCAHRAILAVSSPFLKSLIPSSSGAESKEVRIAVSRNEAEIVKMVLRYMYTGQLDFVPTEQVPPLLSFAHRFQIKSLKEQCGAIIADNVTADNVFQFLQMSREYGGLTTLNSKYLAKNFGALFKESPEVLLQLDIDTFSKMLLSSEVNVKSEKVVFESIMKYAERHKKDGKEKMDAIYSTLLPCLRFNLFPMKFVVEELEFHPQLKHLPLVHELYRWRTHPVTETRFLRKHRKGLNIHTSFHPVNKGPSVTISSDGRTAVNSAATYEVATGSEAFEDGLHIWRLKVNVCVYVGVGIVDTTMTNYSAEFHLQPGCYVYYWSGPGYTNGRSDGNIEGFTASDCITVVLSMSTKTLFLVKNGLRCIKKVTDVQGRKTLGILIRSGSSITLLNEEEQPEDLAALASTLGREIEF